MPKVFKKNVWNPDIELLNEEEEDISSKTHEVKTDCCIRCNNRNVLRAVLNRDEKLLD